VTYHDGSIISLGDIVTIPIPSGTAKARVVMLGDTYEHLDIDRKFVEWVERDRVLEASSVVIEWLGANPFAHEDPRYAPVGNYMSSPQMITLNTRPNHGQLLALAMTLIEGLKGVRAYY
jgi:hypothetical protein